jgi:eukaryotic-like serine/threonine-protein kinase
MEAPAPGPGRSLGHYRLETYLGSGPMGLVYLARAPHVRRPVAIKVLAPDRLDHESRRRLRVEAVKLARLRHRNVAAIFDFASTGGYDYIVMEVVTGSSLEETIKTSPLPASVVASLGAQLARGLDAVHSTGVVHGALTPGNVRVTPQGVLKILDFGVGLSRGRCPLTRPGGNPLPVSALHGLAPERLLGLDADVRADVFSAGAILYELICGRPVHAATDPRGLMDAILNRPPDPPSAVRTGLVVDPRLEAIVMRALDRNPNARFQRASEMADALDALQIDRHDSLSPWLSRAYAISSASTPAL